MPNQRTFFPPGLGSITIDAPLGKLSLTPATQMAVDTIGANRHLMSGRGIDWGSGSGVLTVAAAKIPEVECIVGLELAEEDMAVARANAEGNGVAGKVTFIRSDSFEPFEDQDGAPLDALVGNADFLIANPPGSQGDDGLGWRRSVLRGALRFVKPGAPLLVQISYQYNVERIARLAQDIPGYTYEGVIGTSDWIEFDQSREDLAKQLVEYRDEERAGGTVYTFRGRRAEGEEALPHLTATEALDHYRETGESPMSKWQMHLFRRQGIAGIVRAVAKIGSLCRALVVLFPLSLLSPPSPLLAQSWIKPIAVGGAAGTLAGAATGYLVCAGPARARRAGVVRGERRTGVRGAGHAHRCGTPCYAHVGVEGGMGRRADGCCDRCTGRSGCCHCRKRRRVARYPPRGSAGRSSWRREWYRGWTDVELSTRGDCS